MHGRSKADLGVVPIGSDCIGLSTHEASRFVPGRWGSQALGPREGSWRVRQSHVLRAENEVSR